MKIIICDDCRSEIEEIRKLCEDYSEKKGLEASIEELTDPMALLERNPLDADILILDVEMGDVSGIEIKDELAQRENGPLVIFVTSHPEAMSRAFNRNVIGFLLKPPDVTAFGAYMDSAVNILTADKHFIYPDGGDSVDCCQQRLCRRPSDRRQCEESGKTPNQRTDGETGDFRFSLYQQRNAGEL